jgi:hypothetical protein
LAFDYPTILQLTSFLLAELKHGQTAPAQPLTLLEPDQLALAIAAELTALENLLQEYA